MNLGTTENQRFHKNHSIGLPFTGFVLTKRAATHYSILPLFRTIVKTDACSRAFD